MVDLELDELRREFLSEAKQKVQEIQKALDEERSSASLDRLAYFAHQLKGSGGSYGFERISTEAADIEKAAEQLARGDKNDGIEARIQQRVVNLRTEIERSERELSLASR